MRLDARTNAAQTLREWSEGLGVPYLGALRETQLYVRSLERGMTIFDLPKATAETDLRQWEPILNWLKPLLYPLQAANDASPSEPMAASKPSTVRSVLATAAKPSAPHTSPNRLGSSLPNSLMPAQESIVHGARLSVLGSARPSSTPVVSNGKPALSRNVNSPDGLQIPQFLKRAPR
jgi:chromosome partitioning protein